MQAVRLEDGHATAEHDGVDALAEDLADALLVHEVAHVEPGVEVLGHEHAHVLAAARRVVKKVGLGQRTVTDQVLDAHGAQQPEAVRAVLEELLVAAHLVGKLAARDVADHGAADQELVEGKKFLLVELEGAGVREEPAVHPESLVKLNDAGAQVGLGLSAAADVGNLVEALSLLLGVAAVVLAAAAAAVTAVAGGALRGGVCRGGGVGGVGGRFSSRLSIVRVDLRGGGLGLGGELGGSSDLVGSDGVGLGRGGGGIRGLRSLGERRRLRRRGLRRELRGGDRLVRGVYLLLLGGGLGLNLHGLLAGAASAAALLLGGRRGSVLGSGSGLSDGSGLGGSIRSGLGFGSGLDGDIRRRLGCGLLLGQMTAAIAHTAATASLGRLRLLRRLVVLLCRALGFRGVYRRGLGIGGLGLRLGRHVLSCRLVLGPTERERLRIALRRARAHERDLANGVPELLFLPGVLAEPADDAVDVTRRDDLARDAHKRACDAARVASQVRRQRSHKRRCKKIDGIALPFGELSGHIEGPFDKSTIV